MDLQGKQVNMLGRKGVEQAGHRASGKGVNIPWQRGKRVHDGGWGNISRCAYRAVEGAGEASTCTYRRGKERMRTCCVRAYRPSSAHLASDLLRRRLSPPVSDHHVLDKSSRASNVEVILCLFELASSLFLILSHLMFVTFSPPLLPTPTIFSPSCACISLPPSSVGLHMRMAFTPFPICAGHHVRV
jgi:hypothetical protein